MAWAGTTGDGGTDDVGSWLNVKNRHLGLKFNTQGKAAAPGCAVPQYNSILPNPVVNPKYVEWNLELQKSIGQKTSVSINYVGNRGSDIYIFNPWVNAGTGSNASQEAALFSLALGNA